MFIRPELTIAERAGLGRLIGWYRGGEDVFRPAPSDPIRTVLDGLVSRQWVERVEDGYKINQWGRSAYYTGKIVQPEQPKPKRRRKKR